MWLMRSNQDRNAIQQGNLFLNHYTFIPIPANEKQIDQNPVHN